METGGMFAISTDLILRLTLLSLKDQEKPLEVSTDRRMEAMTATMIRARERMGRLKTLLHLCQPTRSLPSTDMHGKPSAPPITTITCKSGALTKVSSTTGSFTSI